MASEATRSSLGAVTANLVGGVASMAGGIVLARMTSQADYGAYSQVILLTSSIALFASLGLPNSILYMVPLLPRTEQGAFIVRTLAVICGAALALSAALAAGSAPLGQLMNNPDLPAFALVAGATLFVTTLWTTMEPVLIALDRVRLFAVVKVVQSLAAFAAIAIPLMLGASIETVLWWSLAATVIPSVAATRPLWGAKVRAPGTSAQLGGQIRYGAPLMLSTVVSAIGRRIDQFMIAAWVPLADFAVFSRGAFEIPLVDIIPGSVSRVMIPFYARAIQAGRLGEVRWYWFESSRRVALLFFPLFVYLFIVSPQLFVVLFSDRYLASVGVFRVYLLMLPLRINVYGSMFKAADATVVNLYGIVIFAAANIVLNYPCYRLFGLVGPAIATVVALVLQTAYLLYMIRKQFGWRVGLLMPWAALSKTMAVSAAAGVAAWGLARFEMPMVPFLVASFVAYSTAYLAIGWVAGIFTKGDIDLVTGSVAAVAGKLVGRRS